MLFHSLVYHVDGVQPAASKFQSLYSFFLIRVTDLFISPVKSLVI